VANNGRTIKATVGAILISVTMNHRNTSQFIDVLGGGPTESIRAGGKYQSKVVPIPAQKISIQWRFNRLEAPTSNATRT
jgi:hypothetical protein